MNFKSSKRATILVADDQYHNLQLIAALLKPHYNLLIADCGEKALEIANVKKPDLILLDVMMPDLSGFDVCRKLKENPETVDIPVIFLTAKNKTEDLVEAFEVGCADFLTKPINKPEVYSRIKTHLDLKLSKDQIKNKNIVLEKNNQDKARLLSIIAHDLKSPFSVILGYTELLTNPQVTLSAEKQAKIMSSLHNTATGAYEILSDLLQWSRLHMDRCPFSKEPVRIRRIITDVFDTLRTLLEAKTIKYILKCDESIIFSLDKNMIKTILRNLISNSLKFTPKYGEISVNVAVEKGNLIFSVKDSGIGMDNDTLSKIFKVEEKTSSTGTEGEKGTGLGLILCKDFIELHNGRLTIDSEVGRGTVVTCTIPG